MIERLIEAVLLVILVCVAAIFGGIAFGVWKGVLQ